ncbi:hypothetical protein SAMN04488038_10436 [Solimonas aquatica]|uniref:Uncharacterized protein n=1 Tax=Solimonas aquatica TaxID=489703 RepID=A0A1H9DH45_9GAMM|nr:hypothetical protein SAMN04488038_10436 [Solimonas aquatica]
MVLVSCACRRPRQKLPRRSLLLSLLVQREVPKRNHALRLASVAAVAAPAGKRCSRARGRCRRAIHGAAATESNFLFDSPTALAALLGARQRGASQKQQRSDAPCSKLLLLWLLTLGSPSLALSCAARAGESRLARAAQLRPRQGWRVRNGPEHVAQLRHRRSGRQSRGVLSLAYFSLHKQREQKRPTGELLRPPPKGGGRSQ